MNNFYGGDIKPEFPINPDIHLKWKNMKLKFRPIINYCLKSKYKIIFRLNIIHLQKYLLSDL